MGKIRHRVAGSSILEVVIAMVIIIMVLGVSLTIYSNVMRQSLSQAKLHAQLAVQQSFQQAREGKQILAIPDTAIMIEQEETPYEEGSRLLNIHVKAFNRDHELLAEGRTIIIKADEN
jgi:type II secretory pathway pseudopilin PulG